MLQSNKNIFEQYNKQQDFYKKLLRKTKRLYFSNLDMKKVVDYRNFWKTFSPLFSTKCSKGDKTVLNETDKYVRLIKANHVKFLTILYKLSNIISDLQIPSISKNISDLTDITDPVLAAIDMFEDHPSVKNIRAKNFKSVFSLTNTNEIELAKNY